MDPKKLVAVITGPTIVWLFARFAFIARRQHGHIRYHLRRSLKEGRARSSVAFAIHVILGFGLLCFAPYLAYLSVPPTGAENVSSYVPTAVERALLALLAIALITMNTSVLWLVPHPRRYKQYGCITQRELVSALSILTVAAVEFVAMPMAALGLLIPPLKQLFVAPTVIMYIWCAAVCICELAGIPWEKQWWGLATLQLARPGSDQKSKLTKTYVDFSDFSTRAILWTSFAIPATVSALQNSAMMFNWTFRPRAVPPGQELFFVLMSLFSTLAMSAGFFTQAQLSFEITAAKESGNIFRSKSLEMILGVEVLLTQVLPLALLSLGPHWTGHENFTQFNLCWNLWIA